MLQIQFVYLLYIQDALDGNKAFILNCNMLENIITSKQLLLSVNNIEQGNKGYFKN